MSAPLLQKKIDEHLEWVRQRAALAKSQTTSSLAADRRQMKAANQPSVAEPLPLGMILADEIGVGGYEPPLEIVEGLLAEGALSLIYGDSNTGKTFLALDMACAVSRGIDWMGRRTVPGLVIYVAAESPASVRGRLCAYQMHHKCRLGNLVVVQHPVDLLRDSDVGALIQAIKLVEERVGQKAQLIVGDTMARMTVGANENSVEDMGLAISNCDAVRRATGAHFCLVHHSGKDLDKGPRGHTSLRAAVDTELQVALIEGEEDEVQGRRARVTKQRDLPVGESIDFGLRVVEIGRSQWGGPVTSCVVVGEGPGIQHPGPRNLQKQASTKVKRLKKHVEQISEDGWEPTQRSNPSHVTEIGLIQDQPLQSADVEEEWEDVLSGFELRGKK